MTTINGTLLQTQFNNASITVTNAEIIIDASIDLLNTYDADLTNLTGAAGSKTGTYTSKQAGAIMSMAREVYRTRYMNADGKGIQVDGVSINYTDQKILEFAQNLAQQLIGKSFERA